MTVSFADPFDSAQFSKKYSVILKGRQCPRVAQPANGCVSGI